jgi:hypothetical protein
MKIYLYTLILGAAIVSCEESPKKNSGQIVSSIAAGAETDNELKQKLAAIEKEESKRISDEKANVTSLKFDRLRHDFGDIMGETDNGTSFRVTNTGDKPLIIDNVKASCGCTTPKKPEGPILPGKSDVIEVNFHPNADQKNEIIKTITVAANTEPRLSTLTIRAFVK